MPADRQGRGRAALGVVREVSPVLLPVLFASYPLVSLYEQNQTELPLAVLWSPLATAAVVCVLLFGMFMLIFRRGTKAGVLASLVVVAFFYYEIVKGDISGWGLSDGVFLALWCALFVAAVVAVVRTRWALGNLSLGLGIAAAVLAVVPAVRIARYEGDHQGVRVTDPRLWPASLAQPVRPRGASLPDIYVIIPDDYARADVLKRYFHYDNAHFVAELRKRGFVISDLARSPYSDSESNIAAELNMDYLSGLPKIVGAKSQDVRPVKTLIEDNRASRLLKPLGYRYVHLDSDEVTFAAGNPDISSVATPDSFTSLWLRKSVLRKVGGRFGFNQSAGEERYRKAIRSSYARLERVPQTRGPKFVVFHTLIPHDPYVFGAQGQRASFPLAGTDTGHGSKFGMRYYLAQLHFVEKKLLESVDVIRARSKQPPLIVIQSDEGFEANPETFGEAAMQAVRVKGLTALSLPGVGRVDPPQPPTTINTLRFVFNRYFGTHYPLLRAASYPEGDFPYQWKEMRVR